MFFFGTHMKTILLAVVMLGLSSVVHAGDKWYFGTGVGASTLSYDVRKDLNKSIDKTLNKYVGQINGLITTNIPALNEELAQYGVGPVPAEAIPTLYPSDLSKPIYDALHVTDSFDQSTYSFYVGYKFTRRFSVELGMQRYQAYSAQATLPVNFNIDKVASVEGYNVTANATGNAHVVATAEAKVSTTTLTMVYRVIDTDRFSAFLKGGVAYGKADVTTSVRYRYSYTYNGCVDEVCYSGAGSADDNQTEKTTYKGVLPLYGIGGEYHLNKDWSLRADYSRVGVSSTHIDSLTAGLIFRF
jgi:opacity protein-like surface antigen